VISNWKNINRYVRKKGIENKFDEVDESLVVDEEVLKEDNVDIDNNNELNEKSDKKSEIVDDKEGKSSIKVIDILYSVGKYGSKKVFLLNYLLSYGKINIIYIFI
jgi:hypothetical protein